MAKKVIFRRKLNQQGFTLLEVLMALTLFGFFITAFMIAQGYNISSSSQMREDITLHNLTERKINESILNLPKFTNATENDIKTGNFEEEGFKQYKFKIEYKKLEFPDFGQITGKSEDEDDDNSSESSGIEKKIYDKLKKNMEEIIWQIRVTVTNSETDYSYELTSWVINDNAKVDTNFSL